MRRGVRAVGAVLLAAAVFLGTRDGRADEYREAMYVSYSNWAEKDPPLACRVEIDPVIFPLVTLAGKYRMVCIRLENRSKESITLSRKDDRVTADAGENGSVPAVLDLSATDPNLWDPLDMPTRRKLAYPTAIEPGKHRYVYVLFPHDKLALPPDRFKVRVASLDKELELQKPRATARE